MYSSQQISRSLIDSICNWRYRYRVPYPVNLHCERHATELNRVSDGWAIVKNIFCTFIDQLDLFNLQEAVRKYTCILCQEEETVGSVHPLFLAAYVQVRLGVGLSPKSSLHSLGSLNNYI